MLEIQPVTEKERSDLFGMAQRYWAELMPRSPVVKDPTQAKRYFGEWFRPGQPGSHQFWAIKSAKKIGFANIHLSKDFTDHTWAEIRDFHVEPQCRRHGLGKRFMAELSVWMKSQNVYRIDLFVRLDNPIALDFWKSCGFEVVSYRMRRYEFDPGRQKRVSKTAESQ